MKGENFHVEGNAEKDERNVVSGETVSGETEKEMLRRDEVMRNLEQEQADAIARGDQEIVRAFEDASGITSPSERLDMTIDNLLDHARALEASSQPGAKRVQKRISKVVNRLRELL